MKADFEAITDFVNRTFTISASGVNSWVDGVLMLAAAHEAPGEPNKPRWQRMRGAPRRASMNTSSSQAAMATYRCACPQDTPWSPLLPPPYPWGFLDAQSAIHRRYLSAALLVPSSPPAVDANTYGRRPRYCHLVAVLHVGRRQYPGTLGKNQLNGRT